MWWVFQRETENDFQKRIKSFQNHFLFVWKYGHLLLFLYMVSINPLSPNFTKWSNKPKQLVDKLPTNCLSVFDHFVGWHLKGWPISGPCSHFSHSLKTPENVVFWCFYWVQNTNIGQKWVKTYRKASGIGLLQISH